MKLHSLQINGYRRIKSAKIMFGEATFLIGANNAGKSSVLKALDGLLSDKKQLDQTDFYSEIDEDTGEVKIVNPRIQIEAEFRNLPENAIDWRGFKGRIFKYADPQEGDSGLSIVYRKTYESGTDVIVELKSKTRKKKIIYEGCKTPNDYINCGVSKDLIEELFSSLDASLTKKDLLKLDSIDSIWDIGIEEEWFVNPGGIPGNVLSKLPKFLLIPASSNFDEIANLKTGALGATLTELFEDVRNASDNYKQAQTYLDALAKELDPNDKESEFGKMMDSLNLVLSGIFPESKLHAIADLSDPDTALKPSFDVEMSSNIRTTIKNQGTGMIRSAVFGLLRFRQKWKQERAGMENRSLIIGFEEPEIYLHPSAANQMRDTIYSLSGNGTQILATTHSPYLIDISRKPKQVLNRFHYDNNHTTVLPFSITEEYKKLENDDKQHVKMLLKLDDHIARVFFAKKVVIVEGDTEEIVLREALNRLPYEIRIKVRANYEIVKARGKASIIGLVRYLNALGVDLFVIHDSDEGCPNAEKYNKAIVGAVVANNKILMLETCMEEVLGYEAPSSEKPFKAYQKTLAWGDEWVDVPEKLRLIMSKAFSDYITE